MTVQQLLSDDFVQRAASCEGTLKICVFGDVLLTIADEARYVNKQNCRF